MGLRGFRKYFARHFFTIAMVLVFTTLVPLGVGIYALVQGRYVAGSIGIVIGLLIGYGACDAIYDDYRFRVSQFPDKYR